MDTTVNSVAGPARGKYRVSFNDYTTPYSVTPDRTKAMNVGANFGAAIAMRHLETVNMLFVDGHVKSLNVSQMSDGIKLTLSKGRAGAAAPSPARAVKVGATSNELTGSLNTLPAGSVPGQFMMNGT